MATCRYIAWVDLAVVAVLSSTNGSVGTASMRNHAWLMASVRPQNLPSDWDIGPTLGPAHCLVFEVRTKEWPSSGFPDN